jgi:putative MFS transporter
MLPIAFALMAETVPARHRGWLMVLIGGDVAGAYILTALLASWLEPHFGWRILWLIGLPTGVVLLLLNRWIPESPRYLILTGRTEEAREVMARYGAVAEETPHSELEVEERVRAGWGQLLARPFRGLTATIVVLGLGVGLVTFGFQLWIPSNLRALGFDEASTAGVLFVAALLGFPATFGIAFLYGFWSSKKTLAALAAVTVVALAGFVVLGDRVVEHRGLLYLLLIMPITGISSLQAVLAAYGSEIYPTRIRSRGTGLAAGATKVGGVAIIAAVALALAPPSIAGTALIGGIPLLVATALVLRWGIETRRRPLEEITAEELHAVRREV